MAAARAAARHYRPAGAARYWRGIYEAPPHSTTNIAYVTCWNCLRLLADGIHARLRGEA